MTKYGLIKTLKDADGEDIVLCGNAMTFILYKSYFGRDLLSDVIAFAGKNAKPDVLAKFEKYNVKSTQDLANIDDVGKAAIIDAMQGIQIDTEFMLNFIAALIATAKYPQKPDVAELIMSVPPYFLTDAELMGELLEFFAMFISTSQKKTLHK